MTARPFALLPSLDLKMQKRIPDLEFSLVSQKVMTQTHYEIHVVSRLAHLEKSWCVREDNRYGAVQVHISRHGCHNTNRVARHGMYHQKQWTVAECHPAYPSMSPLTATTPTLTQLFLQARTPFLRSDSAS